MESLESFSRQRQAFWEQHGFEPRRFGGFSGAYHRRLKEVYRHNVTPGASVLEIGCGGGDLLAALQPARGVGIDFSGAAIERARTRYPDLEFHFLDAHEAAALDECFDVIILSDLLNDVYDVQAVLEQLAALSTAGTRIVLNVHSHLWAGAINFGQRLGWASRRLQQNWLTVNDVGNLLALTGLEPIRHWAEIVVPLDVPFVSGPLNRVLPKLWPLSGLALAHFIVARPQPASSPAPKAGVSVVVPARNEAGHVAELIDSVPVMGSATEVIFVEGGSQDDTYAVIEANLDRRPDLQISLLRQGGRGKADAVRLGFERARHEILMILDADISVMPPDLVRFYRAVRDGRGELVNGVRLVYPMADRAMRLLNLVANKFFSYGFQFALGQPIKDTLCGTKALTRENYEKIAANRSWFGDFDPYGDFDLIFGAARLNLKIVDMPVRYQARNYGETNISRWSGGWLLLKMLVLSLFRIRFV